MRTTVRRGVTINEAGPGEGCAALAIGWTLGWGTGAFRALVTMKGWEWFVADTFGVRTLSFIQAWGLLLLINFTTYQLSSSSSKNESGPFPTMVAGIISSLLWSIFGFTTLLILTAFL